MKSRIIPCIIFVTFVIPNLSFAKWDCNYRPPAKVKCVWVDEHPKKPDLFYKDKLKSLEFSSCALALKSNEIPASEKLKLKKECKLPISNRKVLDH